MRKGSRSISTGSSGREPSTASTRDHLLLVTLPAEPASVPRARALASDAARAHVSRESLDLVRQALTEVLTHAIVNGRARGKVTITISLGDSVHVEIICPKTRFTRRIPRPELGLYILGALTERWGLEPGASTRVWFTVPRWPDG